MSRITGFAPVVGARPRVLILGSMPSRKSLVQQEYYGHPQNAFWRIMGDLFQAGRDLPYARRLLRLRECRIALWDVLESCERPGSLDADIVEAKANAFAPLFERHATITHVFFNGRKAEVEFRRKVRPQLAGFDGESGRVIGYRTLPSTSPAHASRNYEQKLREWTAVRTVLGHEQ